MRIGDHIGDMKSVFGKEKAVEDSVSLPITHALHYARLFPSFFACAMSYRSNWDSIPFGHYRGVALLLRAVKRNVLFVPLYVEHLV